MATRSIALLGLGVTAVGCGVPLDAPLTSGGDCRELAKTLTTRAGDEGGLDGYGRELEALASFHAWVFRQSPPDPEAGDCSRAYATLLREIALTADRQARTRRSFGRAHAAAEAYARYLNTFGATPESYPIRFSYAELLWDLEQWEMVDEQYRMVVTQDPAGDFSEAAARRAVMNLSHWFSCGETPTPEQTASRRPLPLPSFARRRLEAYDRYLAHFPETSFADHVRHRRAGLLHQFNHFPRAAAALDEIARRTPADRLGHTSAAWLLDSLRATGAAEMAASWARYFRQLPALVAEESQNNEVRAQIALALDEPAPPPVPMPPSNRRAPDVIPGQSVLLTAPFLPDTYLERHGVGVRAAPTTLIRGRTEELSPLPHRRRM